MENAAASALDPAHEPHIADDELTAIYRAMVRARAVDARMVALQRQGIIEAHASAHGEEAAIVGSAAALRATDWIFPAHREVAASLWRGLSLATYVNHMFGNAGDPSRGRQTPDHLGSRALRVASMSSDEGRAGAQITQAAGFAWAAKMKREDIVTLVYFDERATEAGEFHNGANFAGVFKTPLVLFCRNGTPQSVPLSYKSAAEKGVAYAIPAVQCDGTDVIKVYEATRDAAARARSGGGPTLIEAITPRASLTDPLARLRRHLESSAPRALWSDVKQRELDASLDAEIGEAIAAAEALGPPAPSTMFDDVFATLPRHLEEQRSELARARKRV